MNFSELPASKQWASLKYRGEKFAEVWFKPEDDPLALIFSIPQENFHVSGIGEQLTLENLLKAVALMPEEVESWFYQGASHSGLDGANPDFQNPLTPPQDTHLDIYVRLKPPLASPGNREVASEGDSGEQEFSPGQWQELEARWKSILGLEATLEALRMSMEGLLNELENALKKTLTIEEKTYALRADVSQWERAKHRVHFGLPKVKDFIHRAVWALGLPERKRLGEFYKDHIQPQVPFPQMGEVLKQMEELQKDRQILTTLGKTVQQESKGIAAEIQSTLRTLQNNARARSIKDSAGPKGRRFLK